jgi:hypothetical protein
MLAKGNIELPKPISQNKADTVGLNPESLNCIDYINPIVYDYCYMEGFSGHNTLYNAPYYVLMNPLSSF